jgi:hypothetical protein
MINENPNATTNKHTDTAHYLTKEEKQKEYTFHVIKRGPTSYLN